jgi:hypothetical protein
MSDVTRRGAPRDDKAAAWAAHRAAQLDRWRKATAQQRLDWLEEMLQLALAVGALPRPRHD